jgi:hypothetical protein
VASVGAQALDLDGRVELHAMAERRGDHALHVFGQHEIPPLEHRGGLRRPQQHDPGAG